ncbi:MAG TPA: 5-(carboxyamino)imidazole ribonucleotide synthase, partial [Phycisphaerales bacterium]|nr:5-(carboxyamino)imidazole ribonucleotide synthase [Phycisphaerales bacterium]
DVATYEFENVPAAAAAFLTQRVPLFPPGAALHAAQDRVREKELLASLGVPVPRFAAVSGPVDLDAALSRVGLPAVLKTRTMGYDGKGQAVIRTPSEAREAVGRLAAEHRLAAARAAPSSAGEGALPTPVSGLILEELVPFVRELSLISVGAREGIVAHYPLVENHHAGGMLRTTRAPAPGLDPRLQARAERHAAAVLESLGYVGVLAIEFFEVAGAGGPELLANELAPRVHNSGHWTIEGAATSQFENHLRAILGWPLGPCDALGPSLMFNLVGSVPDLPALLAVPGAAVHLYGKTPRPGRKLGHVTVRAAGVGAAGEAGERGLVRQAGHIAELIARATAAGPG